MAENRPAGMVTDSAETARTQDWQVIEGDSEYQALVREKRSFIVPATIFFIVYYFAFLVIVGYVPNLANANVIGNINVAYLFALSQFVVAWIIMALYVRRANVFDNLAGRIVAKIRGGKQ
ncbi:MAG TPA: DUF485 domain-containing protein [Ktedonobacterales bacterium]|jgi:uncharacterized membrane protein (DUF485 family)|nr:DUF485 domain-containing protein [Ktedonobacterales bacterium]